MKTLIKKKITTLSIIIALICSVFVPVNTAEVFAASNSQTVTASLKYKTKDAWDEEVNVSWEEYPDWNEEDDICPNSG